MYNGIYGSTVIDYKRAKSVVKPTKYTGSGQNSTLSFPLNQDLTLVSTNSGEDSLQFIATAKSGAIKWQNKLKRFGNLGIQILDVNDKFIICFQYWIKERMLSKIFYYKCAI